MSLPQRTTIWPGATVPLRPPWRLAAAGEVGVAVGIDGEREGHVVVDAAEISRIDEGGAGGIELGDEGVATAAERLLKGLGGGGEVGGGGDAGDVGVAGVIGGQA